MCIISFVDKHQGWLTLILFALGFWQWKKTHIKERESNYYLGILEKIIALRYLLLELRQPKFLPKKIDRDYVEKNLIPQVNTIMSHSYVILKGLSSTEEVLSKKRIFRSNSNKNLTNLYRNKISALIIKKLSFTITLFLDGEETDIMDVFFPSENKDARKLHKQDDTGLHIFDDSFNKTMTENFELLIREIEKFII